MEAKVPAALGRLGCFHQRLHDVLSFRSSLKAPGRYILAQLDRLFQPGAPFSGRPPSQICGALIPMRTGLYQAACFREIPGVLHVLKLP